MKILLKKHELFMVPLKDLVVFPRMVVPLFVGRRRSLRSVEEAMRLGRPLFLVSQKKTGVEEPDERDVHGVGTAARILQMLKLPDGKIRLLVEGQERAVIVRYSDTRDTFRVIVRPFRETREITPQLSALMRAALSQFTRYSEVSKKVPPEAVTAVQGAELPDLLVDLIAGNLPLKLSQKLELLSVEDPAERLEKCASIVASEIEVLTLEQEITGKVRRKLEKTQKDYFLTEQLKEIQKELGAEGDDPTGAKELEEKVGAKGLPAEVAEKCRKELKRLVRMQPMSPESALLRTYLEWIVDLPWKEVTTDNRDIERARIIMDEDHYDLKKVKERILDFIAVRQLSSGVKGPILCFVGPPGTGKTSLGRSVARSLGRNFVRVSLGGVRDEAEIRGHRKTYVGALPGKIIQSMRKAGSRNPVFLLDEIDKMSSDWRGDPASALLEVLDPEQNSTFLDHYLEVPYDLSPVMFITTANSVHNIPYPLRDRMEVIEISGYTELEKEKIAERFLVPKQVKENGLAWADITFQKPAILRLIRGYTMEAGVRNLEREIANILRKIAREAVKEGKMPPVAEPVTLAAESPAADSETVDADSPDVADAAQKEAPAGAQPDAPAASAPAADPAGAPGAEGAGQSAAQNAAESAAVPSFKVVVSGRGVEKYLGKEKFLENTFSRDVKPGLAYGLAWTEVGGQLLPVEVAILAGKGDLLLTGSLGDVMKESAQAALSFLRAHHAELRIPADFTKDRDIHIHVPEGAIPKDGPSAGISLTAALLSAVSGVALKSGFAMTGEITLTGRLLPIGGVKEKVLAAHRYKMTHVLLPRRNEKDLEEIPVEVQQDMVFEFADSVLDAIAILFPPDSFPSHAAAEEPAAAPEPTSIHTADGADEPSLPTHDAPLDIPPP
ncbi:MAG TPA: endopeptidase La [Spirochaetia bacterium]|nr:endopeptidase La [Spirochaetia bacterium]